MANAETNPRRLSTAHLILVPAIISLAVTSLRLVGELQHWSKTYFNTEVGGGGAIVGMTWLAPIFGIYFTIRLAVNERPCSALRAIAFGILGVFVIFASAPAERLAF